MSEQSPAWNYVEQLVAKHGAARAHDILEEAFAALTVIELAALEHDFASFWARPIQRPPPGEWRSWGALGARGIGKTTMFSSYANAEVEAGRVRTMGLAAQNEDKCVEVQIEGKSGLIATAPPWFKPRYETTNKELTWPNGAKAFVYTPESPDPIYGGEFELAWLSDVHAWPRATGYLAYANFLFATRAGYARLLWDANPRRGSPILKALRARSKQDPTKHVIVGGRSHDNEVNLGAGVIADWEAEFGGTQKGREDLEGIQADENAENPTAHVEWIETHRRFMPETLARRGLSIDPAVSRRRYSDRTAIIDGGKGVDGQGYVFGDYSGKHAPPTWAGIIIDKYFLHRCDVVVCERNKGGDLVISNLRAYAERRRVTVVELGKLEPAPGHIPGVIHVRETYSQGSKQDRAQPLSTAYERGRISHVYGADLASLEETLTTWEPSPGAPSPDDLDALAALMTELLDLKTGLPDARRAMEGMDKVAAKLLEREAEGEALRRLLAGGRGDKI